MGQTVEFPSNGSTATGYLAVPQAGHGPGIVVIQEWWGLVPHITDVCDRFAREGFVALANDLYHGGAASYTEPDEAGKLMMAMELPRALTEMSGAVQYLLKHEAVSGDAVGTVGFCMGGGLALLLATVQPAVKAVTCYYGIIPWPDANPDFAAIRARILGHFAGNDGFANPEAVDALEKQLRDAGVEVEFHRYRDVDHAFFNDTRPEVHDPDAADQSWRRTIDFLHAQLG